MAASALATLCSVSVLVLSPGPSWAAAPGPHQHGVRRDVVDGGTPLSVKIDSLTPAVLPRSGPVTLSGEVVNHSRETWTTLNAAVFTSGLPITTPGSLDDAARSDPAAEVGTRLVSTDAFQPLRDMPPGAHRSFSLSVDRRNLGIGDAPGVYWIGVHVLGADSSGRDSVADARARTFITQMRRDADPAALSFVVPLRQAVRRAPTGEVLRPDHWYSTLGPDGRLDRLVRLVNSAGDLPVTWLVDPAVVDAASALADGNPGMGIGPTVDSDGDGVPDATDPQPSESASPQPGASSSPPASEGPLPTASASGSASAGAETSAGPSATPSGSPTGSPDAGDGASADAGSPQARLARDWLDAFASQARTESVLALPYGDVDVSGVVSRGAAGLYGKAVQLSGRTLADLEIGSTPAVVPRLGTIDPRAVRQVEPGTTLVLDDTALPNASTATTEIAGRAVVLTDTEASRGGPGPGSTLTALAVRQRLLAEAAVHSLSGDPQPVVVVMPPSWDPGPLAGLADYRTALDQPWVDLTPLSAVSAVAATTPGGALTPSWTTADRRRSVSERGLDAARTLVRRGRVLDALLPLNDQVAGFLTRSAMSAVSEHATRRRGATRLADRTSALVDGLLDRVSVEGPKFVLMSAGDGPFQVVVVNGLDQPVEVGVRAEVEPGDTGLSVAAPDPQQMAAGGRTTIRLQATATRVGLHDVRVEAVTAGGRRLGSGDAVTLRTSQIGDVVWVVMGIGGVFLAIAFVYRVARRIRERQVTHGPLLRPGGAAGKDPAS